MTCHVDCFRCMIRVYVSLEEHVKRPFKGTKIWNTINGSQPTGQVGLGA